MKELALHNDPSNNVQSTNPSSSINAWSSAGNFFQNAGNSVWKSSPQGHESYRQISDTHCIDPNLGKTNGGLLSLIDHDDVDKRFKYVNLVYSVISRKRGRDVL